MNQPPGFLIGIVLVLCLGAQDAAAEQANQLPGEISDAELEQRLEFIAARLAEQRPNARTWQYGWTGFYGVSAVAQGFLAVDADDNDDETNYIVGAVKSTGALAQMLIRPLPAVQSSSRFQAMPSDSRQERLRKLEQGEALLRENADRAATRRGWKRHLIGIGANLAGGIIIAAFGDSGDAVSSTLVGIAVSEANIWTEPSRAIADLEDYRSNKWTRRQSGRVTWRIVPRVDGVAVDLRF